MLGFNDIVKRLVAVWHVVFTDPAKLYDLELTPKGFKESFWALPVAFLPVMAGRIIAAPSGLFLRVLFVEICIWIVPLMVVVALAGVLGIRDRIIPFVIASNWSQALLKLCEILLIPLALVLPQVHMVVLLVVYIFIPYRIFRVSLEKSVPYTIAFMVFYLVMMSVVFIVSADVAGFPVLKMLEMPPEMTSDALQGSLL